MAATVPDVYKRQGIGFLGREAIHAEAVGAAADLLIEGEADGKDVYKRQVSMTLNRLRLKLHNYLLERGFEL